MDGFKYYVTNTFTSLGGNSLFVNKLPLIITSYEEFLKYNKRENISLRITKNIQDESVYAAHIAPIYRDRRSVKRGIESDDRISTICSTEQVPFVQGLEVEEGRFYTASEVNSAARVCVIGRDVQERFFPAINPVGQTIKLAGYNYRVIGILKKRGAFFGNSLDNEIHVPITTVAGNFTRNRGIMIGVAAESQRNIELLKDELTGIVRKARKVEPTEENDFAIFQFNEIGAFLDQVTATAYITVFAISMISLLVGGVGIMNIMVVSVTERTREIGIRKSLGARRRGILMQFLYEAILLTMFGGLPAIIIGFSIAAIALVNLNLDFQLSLTPFVVGFGFSVLVGVISGFVPALRASKLKPVEALAA